MDFWHAVELVTTIVGVAALITVFQMVWGRPALKIEKRERRGHEVMSLYYDVFNRPVASALLIRFGVRREHATVTVRIRLVNEQTGEVVLPPTIPWSFPDKKPMRNIELPAGVLALEVPVLGALRQHVNTMDESQQLVSLGPGSYSAQIRVWCGEHIYQRIETAVVTIKPLDSYWSH